MASSVASYLGKPDVSAQHMLDAIEILEGRRDLAELGPPRSPLAPMPPAVHGGVDPAVRDLVQRWFRDLENDPDAQLDADQIAPLVDEIQSLSPES